MSPARTTPQPLAQIERLLMRWPNSVRLRRMAEEARVREARAEGRDRAALLREAQAILGGVSLTRLQQLVQGLRLAAQEPQL